MFRVPTKEISDLRRHGKVRQANALIRSRQPLDLMQKRLFYLILETIRTTDTNFDTVEFPVPVLKELLGGTYGSFHTDLFAAAQGLVSTSFSILRPSGSWVTTPIFDRIEYLKAGEANARGYLNAADYDVVRARLHDDLEAYLLKLERHYNTQDLVYVLTIPRVRSHRLYEILLHESWRGERPEFEMSVDDLQAFLGIEDAYGRWQDFKRTLKRQQRIVHDFTDLRFEFDGRRTGRSVTHVRFHVSLVKRHQGTLQIDDPHRTIEEIQLANELKEAGYQQDPYAAIGKHGAGRVRNVLKQAKAAQKASRGTKGEIRNVGGFIHYLLEQEAPVTPPPEARTMSDAQVTRLADEYRERFEEARDAAIELAVASLTEDEQCALNARVKGLLNSFERSLMDEGDPKVVTAVRNRIVLEHALVSLPAEVTDLHAYYATQEHGHDVVTWGRIVEKWR